MKNKLHLLIYSLILTCVVFAYLAFHHYSLKIGLDTPTFCKINDQLNCDAAALSSYAEIGSIPVAVLGFCFSFIMLLITVFVKLDWVERTSFVNLSMKVLFGLSALVSVIMGALSFFVLKIGCPFCIASYILSFINLYLAVKVFKSEPGEKFNVSEISEHKGILTAYAFIPVLAWFISGSVQDNYGLSQMKSMISEKVSQWQVSPLHSFSDQGSLIQNADGKKATIVEFADFKCPHCRSAFESLHTFIKVEKDIKFIFKPLPLDGICNPNISVKGDGSRCKMAAWAICADTLFSKGNLVQAYYFRHQSELMAVSDLTQTNKKMSEELKINFEEIETCSNSAETQNLLKKNSEEAQAAGVEGTPTIFLNSKKLVLGQKIDFIRAALETLKN